MGLFDFVTKLTFPLEFVPKIWPADDKLTGISRGVREENKQTDRHGGEGGAESRFCRFCLFYTIKQNFNSELISEQNFRVAGGGGDEETTLAFTCVFKLSYIQKEYICQLQASAPAVDKTFSRNKLWMHIRKIANKKAAGRLYVCKILCDLSIKAYSGRVLSQKTNKQKKTIHRS